jgi:DNA-binding transcriptional regulator YiaG
VEVVGQSESPDARAIRKMPGLSRTAFTALIGNSPRTLRHREHGLLS